MNTSRRYSNGSMPRLRQASITVKMMALRAPACASPINSQFFLPTAVGRIAFSTKLLSISGNGVRVREIDSVGASRFHGYSCFSVLHPSKTYARHHTAIGCFHISISTTYQSPKGHPKRRKMDLQPTGTGVKRRVNRGSRTAAHPSSVPPRNGRRCSKSSGLSA